MVNQKSLLLTGKTPVGNNYVPADEYIPDNEVYSGAEGWTTPLLEGECELACLYDDNEISDATVDLSLVSGPLTKITTSRGLVTTVDTSSLVLTPAGSTKVHDLMIGDQIATAAQIPSTPGDNADENLVKLLSYCIVYGYWEYERMVVDIPTTKYKARREFVTLIDHFHDYVLGDKKYDEFYFVRGRGESQIADTCDLYGINDGADLPQVLWDLNDRDLHTFFSIYYNNATEYLVDNSKVFIEKAIDPELIWPMQKLLAKIGIVARRGRQAGKRKKHRLLVLNKRDVGYITNVLKPLDKYEAFAKCYSHTKDVRVWRREGDIWWDIVKTVDGVRSGEYLDSNGAFIVNNLVVTTSA